MISRRNKQFLRVEQYSQDPKDLGTLEVERYSEEMKAVYAKLLPLLKPVRSCSYQRSRYVVEKRKVRKENSHSH